MLSGPDLAKYRERVDTIRHTLLRDQPYCIPLQYEAASCYDHLGYPDLAAGSLYKCVILLDALGDDSDELHDDVLAQYEIDTPIEERLAVASLEDAFVHPISSHV